MTVEYEEGKVYRPASIDRIGPVIVVTCCDQEFVATIQVCYNQVDVATCAITAWEIDGLVKVYQITGTNQDWPTFWTAFLAVMPPLLAEVVNSIEDEYRY